MLSEAIMPEKTAGSAHVREDQLWALLIVVIPASKAINGILAR